MLGLYSAADYVGKQEAKSQGADNLGTNFQYSKTLTCEGTILLILGIVPYVGWVLGIIGIILLMRGMKEFAAYYGDISIYDESLTGVKYYIVALIAVAIAGVSFVVGLAARLGIPGIPSFGTVGLAVGIGALVAGIVVAFVFFILANSHLRNALNTLAQKSGEHSFATAASLLWWGAILTIIGVGLLLIFVSWILATIGFFTMKPRPPEGYNPPPAYSPTPAFTPPPTPPQQTAHFCPSCGAPVKPDAAFCAQCGKQINA
jgi:uncharacterized membrane protein